MGWARREGIGLDDALRQESGYRSQDAGVGNQEHLWHA
jgi:hypothetical protein